MVDGRTIKSDVFLIIEKKFFNLSELHCIIVHPRKSLSFLLFFGVKNYVSTIATISKTFFRFSRNTYNVNSFKFIQTLSSTIRK